MHVLMTADTIGGVWTYVRELVTGLTRQGVRVTLISFGALPTPEQTTWLDALPSVDYRPTAFKLEWMQDCEIDLRDATNFVAAVAREVTPDVLHFNQFVFGKRDFGIPKIVVAHSDVVTWWRAVHDRDPKVSEVSLAYRDLVLEGLAGADRVVAPSRWMASALMAAYGADPDMVVIYNGRTPSLFSPQISKELAAVSVGRIWDGGKQTNLLLKAPTEIPISIVGDSEHPEQSLRSAFGIDRARAGLSFKGVLSEAQLVPIYARASAYIACSRYEPFGLAPLEAALSRCALVMNDIPSLREVWGEAALYFETNNADSLAAALERVIADADLRNGLARKAQEHALRNYAATQMTEEYLTCYQALLRTGALAA